MSQIVDYVSCSPLRVPIARLAAAQAAIKQSKAHGNDDHCQVGVCVCVGCVSQWGRGVEGDLEGAGAAGCATTER